MKCVPWSEEDLSFLTENWGKKTTAQLMDALGRTKSAIACRAYILGLGEPIRYAGNLSTVSAAALVGTNKSQVQRWIKKYKLKAVFAAYGQMRKKWVIQMDDLVNWLKGHPDLWDSRNMPLYALGSEPEWLSKKRKNDMALRQTKRWLWHEDEKLILMYKQGMAYKVIAERLNRTEWAVIRRLGRMRERCPERFRKGIRVK